MSSSRRSSTSSTAGSSSPLIDPQSSPELVLVNDTDTPNEELDFSSDDESPDQDGAQPDRLIASIPPLPPTLVLLYLFIPYLKLGPMFLPTSDTPLSRTLPTLFICAAFAVTTRELWYLLARYLRKMDIEDVILDAFARGSNNTRSKVLLRIIVRVGTIGMRVLLASVSLRGLHIPYLLLSPEELTCRSLCGCTPPSHPRTLSRFCPRAPHGHSCSRIASPLCRAFAGCKANHMRNGGIIFGLPGMAGCGILCTH